MGAVPLGEPGRCGSGGGWERVGGDSEGGGASGAGGGLRGERGEEVLDNGVELAFSACQEKEAEQLADGGMSPAGCVWGSLFIIQSSSQLCSDSSF